MNSEITRKAQKALQTIKGISNLSGFVDFTLQIPRVFHGTGPIKLIILGQDPTVLNPDSRAKIKTVLDLDHHGNLYHYLERICEGLGFNLDENVYATNLFKNFFRDPPTKIKEINIFEEFLPIWLPLLKEELSQFTEVPIITLGERVLKTLVQGDNGLVRFHWGYKEGWQSAPETAQFSFIPSSDNILNRDIFPFPHISHGKFYKVNFERYLRFAKRGLTEMVGQNLIRNRGKG